MLKKIAVLLFLYHALGTCASQARTKTMAGHDPTRDVHARGVRVVICGSR